MEFSVGAGYCVKGCLYVIDYGWFETGGVENNVAVLLGVGCKFEKGLPIMHCRSGVLGEE